jgi:hypothetical protein
MMEKWSNYAHWPSVFVSANFSVVPPTQNFGPAKDTTGVTYASGAISNFEFLIEALPEVTGLLLSPLFAKENKPSITKL